MNKNRKKILAIILARGGSKRIKYKNLKKLKSKPLINWTIDIAKKSEKFCNIILSSDSSKILNTAKLYKNKILLLKRPKKYSKDTSSSESAVLHALNWYEKKFSKVDYIILLQPTSPFRTLRTINNGIDKAQKSKVNALISVRKENLNLERKRIFNLNSKGFCNEIKNKKKHKQKYVINGLFYLLKKSFFLKFKNFTPSTFKALVINSKKENIDIDTLKDWNYAKKFI